jgi:hypothetical protein
MDLGTIGDKLSAGEYGSFQAFLADFSLIISNCKLYNAEGSDVYEMAVRLEGEWEKLVKGIAKNWKEEAKKILALLRKNPNSVWFLEPVDWKGLGLTDYPQIVKHPMDLGTVASKLSGGEYENPDQFWNDVDLIWKNCMTYNADGSEVYLVAAALKEESDKLRVGMMGSSAPVVAAANGGGRKRKSTTTQQVDDEDDELPAPDDDGRREDMVRLGRRFSMLENDYLAGAIRFIYGKCPSALKSVSGEPGTFDVDLDTLMRSESASSINQLIKVMLYLQQVSE